MHRPVVFLVCANTLNEKRRLKNLREERQSITSILRDQRDHPVEILQEGSTSAEFFFDELRNPYYSSRISIIHFAGHADGAQIRLISEEDQEQVVTADTLTTYLKPVDSLKLVFLNGCGTKPIVKSLLDAGIPAVIATERPIEDEQAAEFAIEFYKGIAGGRSIQDSFEMARKYPTLSDEYKQMQTNTRSLEWEGKVDEEGPTHALPWGLYGDPMDLSWKISTGRTKAKDTHSPKPKEEEKPFWKKPVSMATLGLAVVLAIVGAIYLPDILAKKPKKDDPENPIVEKASISDQIAALKEDPSFFKQGDDVYKVMIIPFEQLGEEWEKFEEKIEIKLKNLAENSPNNAKLGLEVQSFDASTLTEFDGHIAASDAKALGKKRFADMVIWGQYNLTQAQAGEKELNMELYTANPFNKYQERKLYGKSFLTHRIEEAFKTGLPENIFSQEQDILYWAKGNETGRPSEQESEQDRISSQKASLLYFKQVSDNYNPLRLKMSSVYRALNMFTEASEWFHKVVFQEGEGPNADFLFQKGLMYHEYNGKASEAAYKVYSITSRYDSAEVAYSQAIKADPDYYEAYFYRGRLYQDRLKEYENAMRDYKKGLELTNGKANAYVYHEIGKLYLNHRPFTKQDDREENIRKYLGLSIETNPSYGYVYADRGFFYKDIVYEFDSAEVDFRKAIELSPKYPYSYFHLGTMLSDIGRKENDVAKLDTANVQLTKAIEMVSSTNGLYEDALIYRGFNQMMMGKNGLAEADFNKVVDKFKNRRNTAYVKSVKQRVYTSLAILYGRQDKNGDFYDSLKLAVEMGFSPNNLPDYIKRKYERKSRFRRLVERADQLAGGNPNASGR